jgi:cell division protein FtsI/penicillin-binding protein 2
MAHRSIFGFLEGVGGKGLRVQHDLGAHERWAEAILPADADAAMPEGQTNRRPVLGLGVVVGVALALLVARLFVLQVVDGGKNLATANGNRVHERVSRAPRGMIYDRDHKVMAQNQASFDVTVIPQLLPEDAVERRREYAQVGAMIGLSADAVAAKAEVTCAKNKKKQKAA